MTVDVSGMITVDALTPPQEEDDLSEYALAQDARNYLLSHDWCAGIEAGYVGMVYAGILGVFYFRIEPAYSGVDEEVWVIVGDLPPAYITCEACPNPATALDGYCGAMQEWIRAVRGGDPIEDLIPVNTPPTKEYADMLASRLEFIDKQILSQYEDDLGS